jgi:SAM-dependent MidA family methyltransferase
MRRSLYGPGGFFTGPGPGPVGHFRTSAHASPAFAGAVAALVSRLDTALGRPDRLDLLDVGGGRGELLTALLPALPADVAARVRPVVVELAPRPAGLAAEIAWTATLPGDLVGLLLATEWLDNVPIDVAEVGDDGEARYVLVDDAGTERPGPPVGPDDAGWLARWWPLDGAPPGSRAEIGAPRDAAWAGAVAALTCGLALAVDYGHLRASRPAFGTLTGFRDGRQVLPVPDGACDLTAHVAFDSVAAAGEAAAGRKAGAPGKPGATGDAAPGVPSRLFTQREALRALGVHGGRPPLELAHRDPHAYLRALAGASVAAELTAAGGLGDHGWLVQPVGVALSTVIPEVP